MQITSDHLAGISSFISARVRRAHCTDLAEFEDWERHARACYAAAGLSFPGTVIKVRSPHAMFEIVAKLCGQAEDRLDDGNVSEMIYRAAHDPLEVVLDDMTREQMDQMLGPISSGVGGKVGDALARPIERLLPIEDRVRGTWFDDERDGWLNYIRDTVRPGIEQELWEPFNDLQQANDSVGMWWPHREWVIASDRPSHIRLEPYAGVPSSHSLRRHLYGSQLHSREEPAISWSDNTAAWFEHGEHVSRDLTKWYPPRRGALLYSTAAT